MYRITKQVHIHIKQYFDLFGNILVSFLAERTSYVCLGIKLQPVAVS